MLNDSIKIYVYTFCYNEIDILPFIIEYWKQYATKVIVYDNDSTDGSDLYLKQYDWIEVRKYNTNNTFNPYIIELLKNKVYKTQQYNDNDYVMVCDIDEVLMPEYLKLIQSNIAIYSSDYYECHCNKLPNFISNTFAHNYDNTITISNLQNKCVLFNPNKVKNITFTNFKTFKYTDKNLKILKLPLLHLKMFGVDRLYIHATQIYKRINDKKIKYAYGIDYPTCVMINNNILNKRFIDAKIVLYDNTVKKENENEKETYKTVKWENTELENGNITNNKNCIIVIPIYLTILNLDEDLSLKECIKVWGDKYDICLCCPSNLNIEVYKYKYNYNFHILRCNAKYFSGRSTYSWLCESPEWYKCFGDYDYMLIYQTDAMVFHDNLQYFLNLSYDYIGAPWQANVNPDVKAPTVGNGGVSLRNIQTFIKICENLDLNLYSTYHVNCEDLLFSLDLKKYMKIPDVETAKKFAFDAAPGYWYTQNNNNLPMCAHAWKKWDYMSFWKKFINVNKGKINK